MCSSKIVLFRKKHSLKLALLCLFWLNQFSTDACAISKVSTLASNAWSVVSDGEYLFVGFHTEGGAHGPIMRTYRPAVDGTLTEVGSILATDVRVHSMHYLNDLIYALMKPSEGDYGSVVVFNVSDPSHPTLLGSMSVAAPIGLTYHDGYLYTSENRLYGYQFTVQGGISVVDARNPLSLTLVNHFDLASGQNWRYGFAVLSTAATGNRLFALTDGQYLLEFDISVPQNMQLISATNLGPTITKMMGYIFFDNGLLYVMAPYRSFVFDVSSVGAPRKVKEGLACSCKNDVQFTGEVVYGGCGDLLNTTLWGDTPVGKLNLEDLTCSAEEVVGARVTTRGYGFLVTTDYIYVATGASLELYSLANDYPPVANAGADQTVTGGTMVSLDGTRSSDPNGETLTYYWRQPTGPFVDLFGEWTATPFFYAPRQAVDLSFSLEVRDLSGHQSVDTVVIHVTDAPPSVNGVCGPANGVASVSKPEQGLCAVGSPSIVTENGRWEWSCAGANGGATANCQASIIPPIDLRISTLPATKPNGYKKANKSLSFVVAGGSPTLADVQASISSNQPWLKISRATLQGAKGNIYYMLESNLSSHTRTAVVTLKNSTYSVSQAGVPCKMSVICRNKLPIGRAGGLVNIDVQISPNDGGWSATGAKWVPLAGDGWLTGIDLGVDKLGSQQLILSATANATSLPRSAVITFLSSDGASKKMLTIKQLK